jgi:uncharacterized protein (TIGR03118 family)
LRVVQEHREVEMQKRTQTLIFVALAGGALGSCSSDGTQAMSDESAGINAGAIVAAAESAPAGQNLQVSRTDLVADQAGAGAVTDADLVNAWGLAFAPTGVAWVSSNEEGLAQVYNAAGALQRSVTVPLPPSVNEGAAAPTGQVFNGGTAFKSDRFILVTEDGTISGWPGGTATAAELRVDNSDTNAVYKGVTLRETAKGAVLYAADFFNAKVDMFDQDYAPIDGTGRFEDPTLPPGYAPFNVLARGPLVFVSYALQDEEKTDDVAGPGNGYVNVFDASGKTRVRLISRGALNAPWGMELRKSSQPWAIEMLVGNFGDGRINVYQIAVKSDGQQATLGVDLVGPLVDASSQPVVIDGLWAITFGPGAGGFERNELYFTAGPDDEQHGLFGKLAFPAPATNQ